MITRFEQEATVRQYYDEIVDKEDRRLDAYPFELAVTMRYITKYLTPNAKILDAACGTGRYVEALLAAGFQVGASDLAGTNVARTSQRLRANATGGRLCFVRRANVLDAACYNGGPWDGVLMLGPCYHLPAYTDRITALRQATAHVVPGGLLYVSFLSRMAVFWWGLKHRPEGILEQDGVCRLLTEGTDFNFAPPGQGLPNCYFCDPSELEPLFDEAGLVVKHVCGTEGVFGGRVSHFHELEPALREAWLHFTVQNCEAPIFQWSSEHILVVAQRH